VKRTLEREVKLHADPAFELPELGGERLDPRTFVSTYYDTPTHRLAPHGVTLRHRVENGKGCWQLKLPRGAARLELELEGGPARVPDEIKALLAAYLRGVDPVPVARLRTRREAIRIDGAEVVHDSVDVLENRRVERSFDELEVELLEGDENVLRRLERALRRAGAGEPESRPKLFQALDLEYRPDDEPAPHDASPAEVVRAQVRIQLARMLAHDPGTRTGDDPEDVHQMRVATRRLRASLRAARGLVQEGWAEDVRVRAGTLGATLGAVRDLDVLIERLRDDLAGLDPAERRDGRPLLRTLQRERTSARRRLLAALSHRSYFDLLDVLELGPPQHEAARDDPTLAGLWSREHRRLEKAMRPLGRDSSDEELHAARLKVKRARHAAELGAPALGKGGRRYVDGAKELQDVLGEHQDSLVAEERLRRLAATAPAEAAFVAGRLVERERRRRREARAAWPGAWKRLRKAGSALADA
jgi:CHAD domain-containing protein